MIGHPPTEHSFDEGSRPRKSWVDWCLSVFRDAKYKGSGPTSSRPVNGLNVGDWFFDTSFNRPAYVISISPLIWSDIGLSLKFESDQLTLSSGGTHTLPHGLGKKPVLFEAVIVCINPVLGYTAGQETPVPHYAQSSSTADAMGFSIAPDSTNLNLVFGNAGGRFMVINRTTNAMAQITDTDWKLIIRAWA